jgi:hypothetical protein
MKKQAYMTIAMVVFVAVVGLSNAKAQTSGPTILQVDIPFAFGVGNQTLPAGKYRVVCVPSSSDIKVLQLRDQAGLASALVRTSSVIGKTRDDARLVFNKYGEKYFFAQAWLPGDNTGMRVLKSSAEKATARELAAIKRATEVVSLTARR